MVFTASPRRRQGVQLTSQWRRPARHAVPAYGVALRGKASPRRRVDAKATSQVQGRSARGEKQARSRPLSARRGKSRHLARGKGEGSARAGRERQGRGRREGALHAGNRAYTPTQACPIAAGLQRARGKRGEGEEKRACCRPADLSLLLLLHATTPPRPPPALRPSADWSLSVHQLELALCSSADWRPADRRL